MDTSAILPKKILIVEDNRTQAEYLRYILSKEGYSVSLASNGAEALSVISDNKPDLILTDVLMPEMDGYTFCRTIKTNLNNADIPVILVTNLYDPIDVIKGLAVGADNFIIKPFDPSSINGRIVGTYLTRTTPDPGNPDLCLDVSFAGEVFKISANRRQILNILLSTYEIAVKNYSELQETHDRLNYLNEELKNTVQELQKSNTDLIFENSERKRVETALAGANNKLQLMATITRHDLLNQLTSLQGYLEIAYSDREENPENAWAYIKKAMKIVGQTVETVRFTDEYQHIGIKSPVWQGIRNLVENSLRHTSLNQIRFDNEIPSDIQIYADPLIEKVFANLIHNSVKYGLKNTFIRFYVENRENTCFLICDDDGVGIPVEEKEKVFTFQYGKNTGLGLFLSREILSITGITICETGCPGIGARFEICCPADVIKMI
ncbi:hybrid sensor histidine kinase/response regulator [Methanospirillum lacunae]|uniref:Hybrid sensor histidine kinase/response regulator n=1 Tax=Methanospirillum lacunae TaxID=668570 RepID=A0A2V2N3M6_9EURY|nr:hybrid sensor histidine kinase/response regulator [Methanospirillum lacunae]PWR73170.1 hybrid sensor histidine kinase/response regulator [Methanospirillum lacunae]